MRRSIRRFNRPVVILAVAVVVSVVVGGHAFAQGLLPTAPASAAGGAEAATDPLGRQTPAGTVMGFLAAGARGDWPRASRYLDTKLPAPQAEELAQELKVLLDRGLSVDLDRLSRKPEGEQDERLGKDHESIGTIESASGKLDVVLVRVRYAAQPPIWLFSSETLRSVPAVHAEFEPSFLEDYLPPSLTQGYGRRYIWWSWFVVLAAGLASVVIAVVLTRLLRLLARLAFGRLDGARGGANWLVVWRPVAWIVFGIAMHELSRSFLTLRQRYLGGRVATLFIIAAATWLVIRVLASSVRRWTGLLERGGRTERIALVRLAGRLLQTAAVVVGVLAFLRAVGINLTPVLAGLGVGGIAVALASQKTLENLFGGMMVIGDSPVRIGNFCRVGALSGTIEDIGLRSTRLRTAGRTTISIPNADLASQSIENFATRDKMLFNHLFTLRFETTTDQLRRVLAETRAFLHRDERVEKDSLRVRLLRVAPSGFEVEVFAYVLSADYVVFLGIQEELLLGLVEIVEASGTALALPSQTMYFARDAGLAPERAREVEAAVREWRDRGEVAPGTAPGELSPRSSGDIDGARIPPAPRGDVVGT